MRRSLFALTIAIVLVVSAQFGRAQDLVVSRFRDYLESLRVQAGIPALAATIVGSNDVIWEQGFGRQDIDRAIAATPATPFQFDGVTQVFTAAIVFFSDFPFQALLALALLDERDVDRRARVVPEGPEPAAAELKLDVIALDLHERDDNPVASSDGDPVFSEVVAVAADVHRPARVGPDIVPERHTISSISCACPPA